MRDYAIFTDACADLGSALTGKFDIKVIPMEYTVGKKNCSTASGEKEMKGSEFYRKMRKGSRIFPHEIQECDLETAFSEVLEQGMDLLYITSSSQMTSALSRARIVFDQLKKKFPDQRMAAVDSHLISVGEGILVWQAARLRKAGWSLEDTSRWIEENWMRVHVWYLVGDRQYLERSGSLSRAAAMAGVMDQIRPIPERNEKGRVLERQEKLDSLTAELEQGMITAENDTVFLAHGDCLHDCLYLNGKLSQICGIKNICLSEIGPIVGSNTGPGTAALAYLCRKPEGGDEVDDI